MSREIKFRAWDNENKSYLYDVQDTYDDNEACFESFLFNDERYVVEQFTGLKDSNGKEIYEGDILEYYYETHGETFYDPDTLGVVCGEPGIETTVIGRVAIWPSTGVVLTGIKAKYPEDFDSNDSDIPKKLHVNKRFEVVGNVHENPELLEADK